MSPTTATTATTATTIAPRMAVPDWTVQRVLALVERNMMMYRRSITPVLFGLVEPLMYLLTIGFGVGALVGTVPGVHVRYAEYVAPAILATTAMNTALNQTAFGVFIRIKTEGTYDAILPTPLSVTDIAVGEVVSAVLNGLLTSVGFLIAMAALGLVVSPGLLLAVPGSLLIGYAFAAGGMAVTTFLRDFADFQLIQLVMLPMYLFATTFYPLDTYPAWLRPVIEALPLYQSIELIREPALGRLTPAILWPVAYLLAFGWLAVRIASRRMTRTMLR